MYKCMYVCVYIFIPILLLLLLLLPGILVAGKVFLSGNREGEMAAGDCGDFHRTLRVPECMRSVWKASEQKSCEQ